MPDIHAQHDAGPNRGFGVADAFYHFAFEAGPLDQLEAKRAELIGRGSSTPATRASLTEDGRRMQIRSTVSFRGPSPITNSATAERGGACPSITRRAC